MTLDLCPACECRRRGWFVRLLQRREAPRSTRSPDDLPELQAVG
jgi:hypothetical protein